jgi:hypothetical protein
VNGIAFTRGAWLQVMVGSLRVGRCGHSTHDLHKKVSECGLEFPWIVKHLVRRMSEIPDISKT